MGVAGNPFNTTCKELNASTGYITVQGGDYPNAETLYAQRVKSINGVTVP
jgi:hypothetical protein